MDCQRSVILSAVFVSDAIEFKTDALILAFTIPDKKAYCLSRKDVQALEETAIRQPDGQKAYRDQVLKKYKEFKRAPEWDLSADSEAVQRMFADGFYKTGLNDSFYGGMGVTGFFMGLAECIIQRDTLVIKRGLSEDLWVNEEGKADLIRLYA